MEPMIEHATELGSAIDSWVTQIRDGAIDAGMPQIVQGLCDTRARLSPRDWERFSSSRELGELRSVLHECPYTARGFAEPRGYPGDAVLLDFIYGTTPAPDSTTARGRRILEWCSQHSPAFASVRSRRRYFAELIDDVANLGSGHRMLAVACGHLREGALSRRLAAGRIDEFLALDQDPLSLAVVRATYDAAGLGTVHASIGGLIRGELDLGQFDLIYAAGLYDYLGDPVAIRLTQALVRMLREGGRLVVANFVHLWEAGYIEAVMDWRLIYRDLGALERIGEVGGGPEIGSVMVATDAPGSLGYMELRRR